MSFRSLFSFQVLAALASSCKAQRQVSRHQALGTGHSAPDLRKLATIKPNTYMNSWTLASVLSMSAQFLDGRLAGVIIHVDGQWKAHGAKFLGKVTNYYFTLFRTLFNHKTPLPCYQWLRLSEVQMKASKLMPVHICQVLHWLGKLGTAAECDASEWCLSSSLAKCVWQKNKVQNVWFLDIINTIGCKAT